MAWRTCCAAGAGGLGRQDPVNRQALTVREVVGEAAFDPYVPVHVTAQRASRGKQHPIVLVVLQHEVGRGGGAVRDAVDVACGPHPVAVERDRVIDQIPQ